MWAGHVTIDILPDDILLCIFYFIRPEYDRLWDLSWWQPIVHVCRRWRSVGFASPKFLELRLICDPWTRVELTAIWPPFPIIIWNLNYTTWAMPEDYDFDAAIVHPNRVCEIHLRLASSQLKRLASVMQRQFPALIELTLEISSDGPPAAALPDGFLGGSAPRLRTLELNRILFPALPNLLLSATGLVSLTLLNIPHSGYISPEVVVSHLAMLANLESLNIQFESPLSHPDGPSRRPPLPTRTVLAALTRFQFFGVSNYLEDLVARIDTPLLDSIDITFYHLLISDIPQLAQFMRRTTRIQALKEAHVNFHNYGLVVQSLPPPWTAAEKSGLTIDCEDSDWDFSFLGQVLMSLFPSIFMVEHLYIHGTTYMLSQDDVEDMQLLEFFHALTTVKNLYVHMKHAEFFAPILQEHFGGTATDVLPALESLCFDEVQPSEPLQEALGQSLLYDSL
jgi:hypothetical protein